MTIRLLNANPLFDYREACKTTLGINLADGENGIKPPKNEIEYWIKQIVANHSTLRCIKFRIIDAEPKSVVMQIIRATKGHPQPYVQSSRPDWTGKERSKDPYELKLFAHDHTAESFIEMCKQRLCIRSEECTRFAVRNVVNEMRNSDIPFIKAVGLCAKPACFWLKGCPEINGCGRNKPLADLFLEQFI